MTIKNYKIEKILGNILTFCVACPVARRAMLLGVILIFNFFIFNFAQAASFSEVVYNVVDLLNETTGVLLGLAVFFTAYAVYKYLIAGAESTKKGEAATMITWGIIGIFFILSVWGIVFIVTRTFFDTGDLSAPSSPDALIDPRLRGN